MAHGAGHCPDSHGPAHSDARALASRGLVLASRHRVVGPDLGLVRFLRRFTVARAAHMVALMLRLIFTLARFVAVISTLALTMIVSHLVTPL